VSRAGRSIRNAISSGSAGSCARDPVKKSYKKMIDGAALFEERKHLAPDAALRFKLIPRQADTRMEGVELEVAGDSIAIPLRVAPDQTFTIERNRTALKENAQVMPNRKAGTMTWRADVRTPGLPPNVRRLGDLRLECAVGMKAGLISNYPAGFWGWLDGLIAQNESYCHRAAPRYLFFAERPIWSVTLVDGERREVLPVDMLYGGARRSRGAQSVDVDAEAPRHIDVAFRVRLRVEAHHVRHENRVEQSVREVERPADLVRDRVGGAEQGVGESEPRLQAPRRHCLPGANVLGVLDRDGEVFDDRPHRRERVAPAQEVARLGDAGLDRMAERVQPGVRRQLR